MWYRRKRYRAFLGQMPRTGEKERPRDNEDGTSYEFRGNDIPHTIKKQTVSKTDQNDKRYVGMQEV